ncbi:tetratricopeptide repeat protein [Helicobacter monodelphidis]|uniref:tetratricopeptide repeat protein n=1 Tax=Helicobacter sp. 15-1451 TaxID=2004995 RepID=UPI0015EC2A3E|nr:tetratricopeptide repeat protein [Helicobacter sp. 15-1451]
MASLEIVNSTHLAGEPPKNQQEARVIANKALDYLQQGKNEEALALFLKALESDSEMVMALSGTIEAYMNLGYSIHALEYIPKALELDPNNLGINLLYAKILIERYRYNEAKKICERLYKSYPNDPKVMVVYLQYLLSVNSYKTAKQISERLLKISKSPSSYNNTGLIYLELGDMKTAIELFRKGFYQFIKHPISNSKPPEPFMEVSLAKEALLDIKRALDSLKIPFILVAGTLLGIYRDGDILPHDKDIDFGLPWNTPRLELINALKAYGYTCTYSEEEIMGSKGLWNISVAHIKYGIGIDFFFIQPRDDGYVYWGLDKNGKTFLTRNKKFGRSTIEYVGETFYIPDNPAEHLEEIYGEGWGTPQANYNTLILGANIVDISGVGIALCYNHCLGNICEGRYKKAHGYTMQLLSVHNDPILEKVKLHIEEHVNDQQWYEPIPIKQHRTDNTIFGLNK